jgi:hypothetical protein
VQELIEKRDAIGKFNKEQDEQHQKNNKLHKERDKLNEELLELEESLSAKVKEVENNAIAINDAPTPAPPKDRTEIDFQPAIYRLIASVNETNEKATAYKKYLIDAKNYQQKTKELDENIQAQNKVDDNKLEYIKSFDFGFDGLIINEDGELILNNKPIREPYFSRSELEIIVATLYTSINPHFKVRFIDDFECLDDTNQQKLIDKLLKKGFQIITAEVGDITKDNNSILLREYKIVNEEKQKILE